MDVPITALYGFYCLDADRLRKKSASELLFMIFCEQVAEQLGVDDFGAIVAIVSGRNDLPTRAKPEKSTPGTSYAP